MRTLRILLCALALTLLTATAARAGTPTSIDFSGIAAGTEIADQYQNLDLDPDVANEGVLFGSPARFGLTDVKGCTNYAYNGPAAISGISLINGCSETNEFDHYIGFAMRFLTTRRGVTLRLRGRANSGPQSFTVNAKLYGVANQVLESRDVALTDQAQNVSFSRAQPDIAKVVITYFDLTTPHQLIVDDITAPLDDTPPAPLFALALSSPQLEVVEGASSDAPITVERYNGSSGPVTLQVGALPPGIAAATSNPNPITGTAPGALRITAATPAGGDRQVTVTATGGAGSGTFAGQPVTQSVRLLSALTVGTGQQASLVPGCGDGANELLVGVRGGYTGRVDVILGTTSGPVSISGAFITRDAAGNGTLRFPYKLSQAIGNADGSVLSARIRPQNATELTTSIRVFSHAVKLTDAPARLADPTYLGPAGGDNRVFDVKGEFPSDSECHLTFQDRRNKELTVVKRTDGQNGDPDVATLRSAPHPVTSTIRALAPDGTELARTPEITVDSWRNTWGFQMTNGGANAGQPDYSWADFKRDFGDDDADNCYPIVGCSRDGDAYALYEKIRDKLKTNGGLCFGFSNMAIRFSRGQENVRSYDSAAASPWQIATLPEHSGIKQRIVHWQVTQYGSGWIEQDNDNLDSRPTAQQFKESVQAIIRRDGAALVTLAQPKSGHAVVAYDVQDPSPQGSGYDILTYNPNYPYDGSDLIGNPGNGRLSWIHVEYNGLWATNVTGGTPWTGFIQNRASAMQVFDHPPSDDIELDEGFLGEIFGSSASTAAVTSIESSGKELLGSDGYPLAGSGVEAIRGLDGTTPDIRYKYAAGKEYDVTVTGAQAGSYGTSLGGPVSGATADGITTAPGQKDTFTLKPGSGTVGWRTSAAKATGQLTVNATSGGVRREATVGLDAARGQEQQVAISGSGVTVTHAGPATKVSARLQSTGTAGPGAVQTTPIAVGAGGRVELKPDSWSDLSRGAKYTVRNAKGKVVRRGRVKLRASSLVRLGSVSAKLKGKRVTVSGAVTKAGGAPLLVVRTETVRGGKVISSSGGSRRGTAQVRNGRFTLPVTLKKAVVRGAKVRVRVSLTDESADFATATKTVFAER